MSATIAEIKARSEFLKANPLAASFSYFFPEDMETVLTELNAMQSELTAMREATRNDVLTLDELRQMSGEPYWHISLEASSVFQTMEPHWVILPEHVACNPQEYHYGERWIAYRRNPALKEET